MVSIARALSVLGAGMTGYSAGQDEARRRQREEEDAKWRQEQRDRQRTQWQRDDKAFAEQESEKQKVKDAAAPVEVRPELAPDQAGPQAFMVGGQVMGDPAKAEAAAAGMNTPAARMTRAAAVMSDPVKAAQLQGAAAGAERDQLQLEAAKRQAATQAFDDGIRSAASSWDGLVKFLNESTADGKAGAVKFATKKEGGKLTLYPVGPDGTALGQGTPFDDTEQGRAMAAFMFARGTPPEAKLEHMRKVEKDKADADGKKRDDERQTARDAETARHNKEMERIQGITASAAASRAAGTPGTQAAPAPGPAWDDKASAFLRDKYTIKDPMGPVSVDGEGIAFAKQVGLAVSRKNGGDLDQALGRAFEVDNKLRAAATDAKGAYDPKKHAELRAEALRLATQAPAPAGPPADPKIRSAPPGSVVRDAAGNWGAAPAAPAAAAQPAPTMQAAAGDPVLAQVQREAQAAVVALNDQVRQARAQLVAASRSGDAAAVQRYAQTLQAAMAARNAEAEKRLGNAAPQFLATLAE